MSKKINSLKLRKIFLLLLLSLGILHGSRSQNNFTASPYSRYGYGALSLSSSTPIRAMGGISIGIQEKSFINNNNPASYAAVDSQTFIFDFAGSYTFSFFSENSKKDHRFLGNIEYITALMPITKWMGVSLGMKPFSYTGYKFGTETSIEGSSNVTYIEENMGKGNLNDIYLGVGIRPVKNFYLGTNFAYRFGKNSNTRSLEINKSSTYNPLFSEILRIKGFTMDCGLQFILPLKDKKTMTFGATYSPQLPLHGTNITQELTLRDNEVPQIIKSDTTYWKRGYYSPHIIGLGSSFEIQDKLLLGIDVKYNLWKNTFPKSQYFTPQNQWIIALGGAIIPSYSDRSIFKKSTYRFGLQGSNSYITLPLQGSNVSYLQGTIALGMSIPLVDRRSFVDIALDYTHLMPQSNGLVSENYIRLTIGMRFNETWFKKIKLD